MFLWDVLPHVFLWDVQHWGLVTLDLTPKSRIKMRISCGKWIWDMLCACDLYSGHGTAMCLWFVQWTWDTHVPVICAVDKGHACACDSCSEADVFQAAEAHSISTSYHKRENAPSLNWRPLSWPYMEISEGFCGPHATGMWGCGGWDVASYLPDYMCYTLRCLWLLDFNLLMTGSIFGGKNCLGLPSL